MVKLCISCGSYDFAVDLSTGNDEIDLKISSKLDDFTDFIEDCINPVCLPEGSAKGEVWKVIGYTEYNHIERNE